MEQAAGLMKVQSDWNEPNVGASNASLMNVYPAAQYVLSPELIAKGEVDGFDLYGYYALFWAVDEYNTWMANTIYLGYQQAGIELFPSAKTAGICVRCMMDIE